MKSNRLSFFLTWWLAVGGTIFAVHLFIHSRDGALMQRELLECIARALVWGAIIAAVPSAIQGSILKAKSKRGPSDTPPAPTPRLPAKASPTPLPSPSEPTSLEQPTIQNRQIAREPQPKSPIMKLELEGKPAEDTTMDDEAFYEEIAKEIESDAMKPGLWTKAFAEADGEQERAKVLYIRLRVSQLTKVRDEQLVEQKRIATVERERIATEEAERQAEIIVEQERVANEPARLRLEAIQRFKDEAAEFPSFPAALRKSDKISYGHYKLYIGSSELLFVPRDCEQLEIFVRPISGDNIRLLSRFWSTSENVIIKMENGIFYEVKLDWKSHKILEAWMESREDE